MEIFQAFGARESEYNYSFFRAVAQSGSALPWGGRGPGFESRRPDDFPKEKQGPQSQSPRSG